MTEKTTPEQTTPEQASESLCQAISAEKERVMENDKAVIVESVEANKE